MDRPEARNVSHAIVDWLILPIAVSIIIGRRVAGSALAALGQLPAMPCAEAGTAVATTHAPKAKVAMVSDPNVTLRDKLAILYLPHSGCAEAAQPRGTSHTE